MRKTLLVASQRHPQSGPCHDYGEGLRALEHLGEFEENHFVFPNITESSTAQPSTTFEKYSNVKDPRTASVAGSPSGPCLRFA